jgi:hypothetical protein
MEDLLHAPGFLGTNANFAADITLILSLLVGICFSIGALWAKQAQALEAAHPKGSPGSESAWTRAGTLFNRHRIIQSSGAFLNVILVLWLMILPYRDFVLRDLVAPRPRPDAFYWVTTLHAIIGFFAFTIGNFVVLRGNNLVPESFRFQNYKPWMRAAFALYMATTVIGIWVYVTWFITITNTPIY